MIDFWYNKYAQFLGDFTHKEVKQKDDKYSNLKKCSFFINKQNVSNYKAAKKLINCSSVVVFKDLGFLPK